MLHLFMCAEVTTVVGLVVTFIAEVFPSIGIMSLQVPIKISMCVTCKFALVTLEVLFISMSGHVNFHFSFGVGAAKFVITLVALE